MGTGVGTTLQASEPTDARSRCTEAQVGDPGAQAETTA